MKIKLTRIVTYTCMVALLAVFSTGCIDSGSSSDKAKLGDKHDFGNMDPNRVLVLGDSISAGGFSGGPSWPGRLASLSGKSVVNDGIAGATSPVGASRAAGLIAAHRPGFVIIFFGANDVIQGVPAEVTDDSIRTMVRAAKNNQAIPVLTTVLYMQGARAGNNIRVDRINDRIRILAREEKIKLVNMNAVIRRSPDVYLVDGLHLSDTGELVVAMEYADLFR